MRGLIVALWLLCPILARGADGAAHLVAAEVGTSGGGTFGAPPPRVEASDLPPSWQAQTLPHVVARHTAEAIGESPGDIITTWYRLRPNPPLTKDEPVQLYLPRWQTIGQLAIYKDGKLVWRSRAGPIWNGFNHPLWLTLAETGETLPHEVLIRMDSLRSAGGALSTVWIGPDSELRWRYATREFLQVTLVRVSTSAFLLVGLFSFAIWLRRREMVYGLFSLITLLSWLRYLHFHLGTSPLPIPEQWFGWMTVNALGWLVITVYFFNFRLHGRRFPLVEAGMVTITLAVSLATLPGLVPLATLGTWATQIFFITTIIAAGCMVIASWRSRSQEGLAVSFVSALYMPLGLNDALLQSYKINIEDVYLLPYSVMPTLALLMAILLTRYIRALETAEASNLLLETRLAEREEELDSSHRKLREIEHRQMLAQERQRLMRDMHDGIGASLMAAISVVKAKEVSGNDVISAILRDCVDDLKLTIDSLEPVEADLLLLLAALRFRLEQRFTETGLTLHWQVTDLPQLRWLEPASALQVLRILQEVFTNVIKHSGAGEIRVNTGVREDGVYVAVRDDGRGFAVDEVKARSRGRGLANIMHRADELRGKASWSEGGKCFELWLPLAP